MPFEQSGNKYIDPDKSLDHRYFFIRKVMFLKYAQAFIALPGGFGTMDELFETLTLIQTSKVSRVPVILMGSEFWKGLKTWIESVVLEGFSNISPEDLELMPVVDTPQEVLQLIKDFYDVKKTGKLRPNLVLE